MTTLSQLLASREARDAAPCVAVTGKWVLCRNGSVLPIKRDQREQEWLDTGRAPIDIGAEWDCIWSGDLVVELAAVDALRAENERLQTALSRAASTMTAWGLFVEQAGVRGFEDLLEAGAEAWKALKGGDA